ncbi:ribulokinase [candidate division KSB1 bacterium]
MKHDRYVIGIDFGTDSVRTVIVNAANGEKVFSSVQNFTRWSKGLYCDPDRNMFRQHPKDYVEGLENTVREAVTGCGGDIARNITGISIDTTGSTPAPVNKEGVPLAMLPDFEENPNAMFVLWKDHTAVNEAIEITELARKWGGEDFTKYSGGIYSAEWFWAKILHIIRTDKKIRDTAYSWVEHCDWMPALLTGNTDPLKIKRSRCAAGHKAMWNESFGGLPSKEYLIKLNPYLADLRDRLYNDTFTVDVPVGKLSREWAERLGLSTNVIVGAGAFDAHIGALGGEIEPYYLCKIIGTSTCDMLVAPSNDIGTKLVRGICGQVNGSIIPGMTGMEAGQSAFGDVYAWFKDILEWPLKNVIRSTDISQNAAERIIPELSLQAEKVPVDVSGVIALDWINGRRTPDANQLLKGAAANLSLGVDAPKFFRALVESTAFGAKKIVERFISEGIDVKGIIALGGIPKKSPFVMQVLADVLKMEIKIVKAEQACALGAAMCAATVSRIYPAIKDAQKAMGSGFEKIVSPDKENAEIYKKLYKKYTALGEFIEKELTEKD